MAHEERYLELGEEEEKEESGTELGASSHWVVEMRQVLAKQMSLVPVPIAHPRARELTKMSEILDEMPELLTPVHADLLGRGGKPVDPRKGRDGMTAEQVLRAMIVKQMNSYSYEELAFHLVAAQAG
jgi:hypothetical protein